MTTIRISEENLKRLCKYGRFGDSMDDVITKLLEEVDQYSRKKRR